MLTEHVKPGVTTERLDDLVVEFAHGHDAIPAPLNYRGFPKADLHVDQSRRLPRHPRTPSR